MPRRSTALQLAATLLLVAAATAPAAAQAPAPAPAPIPDPSLEPAAAPAYPPPGTVLGSSGAVTNAAGGQHYRVCTSDFPPMSTCNLTAPTTNYGGFDIELFRRAAKQLGWVESDNVSAPGVTYSFHCMEFGDMIADLWQDNGTCALATAGITISSEREAKGITFSYPTYRSSLAVMVYAEEKGSTGWFFFKPFQIDVWIAILLTVFTIPIVTFVTEFLSIEGRILKRDVVPGMKEASWRSMWCMLLMEPFQVTAISSRIIAILYGFLATVLINTYCANLAAALTVSQLSSPINSVEDLRGKAVGTIPVYVPRLGKYGIAPSELEFKGIQSAFDEWIPKLKSGVLVATAIDEPVQQYVAAQAGCAFKNVATFAPFDFGLAWRKGINGSLVDTYDRLLLGLQEDGTVSQLRTTYIDVPRTDCESNVNDQTSISFDQVSGLWIILGAGVGAALLWLIALYLWKRRRLAQKRARAAAEAAAAAAKLGLEGGPEPPYVGENGTGANGHQAGGAAKPRSHKYKAGVAFRQTVSIYGAQIGTHRREAEAAAAAAQEGGWDGGLGGASSRSLGSLPATQQQTVGQLLAHVRQLCDRLEAQAEVSYVQADGTKVVDERIEEVPEGRSDEDSA